MDRLIYDYLTKNRCYTEYEQELLRHGISIMISDGTNIISAFIISLIFHKPLTGIAYLLTFSAVRKYAGGWHASSRTACYFSYQFVFTVMMVLSFHSFSHGILYAFLISGIVFIFIKAPVEHIHNPLTPGERKECRGRLKCIIFAITGLFFISSFCFPIIMFPVCFAVVWNVLCMSLLKYSDQWRIPSYDSPVCNHR